MLSQSYSLWAHELQHARLACPSLSPGVCSKSCPLSQRWHSSHLLSPLSSALTLPQHQGLFQWTGSSHQVAKVLELQYQSFQWVFRVDFLSDGLVWSSCCPRDSQEPSPTPWFKSISSSALSSLYSPTLTSIHEYWKNHSLN